jgi:hypothetical protein
VKCLKIVSIPKNDGETLAKRRRNRPEKEADEARYDTVEFWNKDLSIQPYRVPAIYPGVNRNGNAPKRGTIRKVPEE